MIFPEVYVLQEGNNARCMSGIDNCLQPRRWNIVLKC